VIAKDLNLSRRSFIASAAGAALFAKDAFARRITPPAATTPISPQDRTFLEDYSKRCFRYFWEQVNEHTGIVMDRARMDGSSTGGNVGSSAATGFGLTALCIGAEHGWISHEQARDRALRTLAYYWGHAFHDHGWFYHFTDASTGARRLNSEISSIDTALFLAGVLTVAEYFPKDARIRSFAKQIFERVDFRWMLNGDPLILSHGVMPGSGFLPSRWSAYSEASILYLLAIGSPRHGIPSDSWYAWQRPEVRYQQWRFISGGPLFTHQYSHAWVDFRHQTDGDPSDHDYFENSRIATYAHRDFCISLQSKYSDYGPNMWGLTVSDSPRGYMNWGGTVDFGNTNGTLVPCAAAGSVMFDPDICLPVLRQMHEVYGSKVYGRYGFSDAFNPNWDNKKLWVNQDVIGIDVGISLLSMENALNGNVWRWFMRNPYIQTAMERAGFQLTTPGRHVIKLKTTTKKA